jgi:hypothetical protein
MEFVILFKKIRTIVNHYKIHFQPPWYLKLYVHLIWIVSHKSTTINEMLIIVKSVKLYFTIILFLF